ncbi:PEP phosphonomutase-like protein [Massariosphaeria phaeospora]|uniref:PEP phosphonomutase-like protein n=1 Tax=Massariosphaeria phaeospora TaxID=100035 RepID=A0A7C8MBL0_9PLEO|nr:PEP phosphonomutase-like protein [Massariosphaeria phaeospora]
MSGQPSTQNDLALQLRSLHRPGIPLILTNIWDAISARAIASLPRTRALATASYAIAAAAGLDDVELDLATNLHAIKGVARVAKATNLPLTVDFMDGFGDKLEEGVKEVIKLGAVGINLEDFERETNGLYSVGEAQERVRRVLRVAAEEGVPDFVVNARTDALIGGQDIDEAISRGKAYLEAGAANVFIWSGRERGGTSREEVEKASKALGGRLNVILLRAVPGGLTVKELSEIGVARISVGPQLMLKTAKGVEEEARSILDGEAV